MAAHGTWPDKLTRRQARLLAAGMHALPWDLTFPEVFQPDASGARMAGFDAVLGNPPWDIVQQSAKEFLAGFDLSILNAPTRREAQTKQARLLSDPATAAAFRIYQENFEHQHRLVNRLYAHQKGIANGAATGGKLDTFRVFAERKLHLAGPHGAIGMVVPSSFHANEGATGIRDLYLRQTDLRCCFSFENRRRLFDIHVRQKFALLVAWRPGPTQSVQCGFYLDDLAQLGDPTRIMRYDRAFIEKSGGTHQTFLELRSTADLAIARHVFLRHPSLREWTAQRRIVLGRELNITDDARPPNSRARPAAAPAKPSLLHEGKTIQQFDDRWDTGPRYGLALSALQDKPAWQEARAISAWRCARSPVRPTSAPPSRLHLARLPVQHHRQRGTHATGAVQCGRAVTLCRDQQLRLRLDAAAEGGGDRQPVHPRSLSRVRQSQGRIALSGSWRAALVVQSLGLCDVMAGTTRTLPAGSHTSAEAWPAVASLAARWTLRAAMDAVVAQAYGWSRAATMSTSSAASRTSGFPLLPRFASPRSTRWPRREAGRVLPCP